VVRQEERSRLEPGQLQGGDARQRILAAMGVEKPALAAGEQQGTIPEGATQGGAVFVDNGTDADEEAAAAFEAASARDSAQDATEAPAVADGTAPPACGSPSPWPELPEPCAKDLGHRLVCGNGKATWEKPKGWTGA